LLQVQGSRFKVQCAGAWCRVQGASGGLFFINIKVKKVIYQPTRTEAFEEGQGDAFLKISILSILIN
jgi:hypothetical protein